MATGKRSYASPVTLYQSSTHYGGSDGDVAGTQLYTNDIDLETDGHEGVQILINGYPNGATDELYLYIYASLDGTNFDTVPMYSQAMPNNGASTEVLLTILLAPAPLHLRIGMIRSGSTDSWAVEIIHQRWRYDVSA
jgi:hypothetical protein